MRPDLSIIVPCYNEAPGLPSLLRRFASLANAVAFELVLVDNGSTDGTPAVLAAELPRFPFARQVRVEVNRGYGDGIVQGLHGARADVLAWTHADGQTDPADVLRAYRACRARGIDRVLVKGRRIGRPLPARCLSAAMQLATGLALGTHFSEINAQPKVFARRLLDHLTAPPADFNLDLYVLWTARRLGWDIVSVPVRFPPRAFGVSHWAATWTGRGRAIRRSLRYLGTLTSGRSGSQGATS